MICIENGAPVLYGLVSYGMGCGEAKFPGIYAKVSNQIGWLEDTIKPFECYPDLIQKNNQSEPDELKLKHASGDVS